MVKENSMKTIGIITFHCAENYGAFLQTLASVETLKTLYHLDVSVINYQPAYLTKQNKIDLASWVPPGANMLQTVKSVLLYCITLPHRFVRKIRFFSARKRLPLSCRAFITPEEYTGNSFDYLFLGSDQIWNPEITNGLDPVYFGCLKNCEKSIKFSYAASVGGGLGSSDDCRQFMSLSQGLTAIGVREQSSVSLLEQLSAVQIKSVIDPTLLVPPQVWTPFISHRIHSKKYVAVYQLRDNPALLSSALKFAREHGYTLLHFGDPSIRRTQAKSISSAGPFEFLNYIRYAEAVFTDSFHATCFSLIFQKDFYTFLHKTRSERIIDLAYELGFSERLVCYGNSPLFTAAPLDFPKISKKLEQKRLESLDFLSEILK